jgi:hypothetical protein
MELVRQEISKKKNCIATVTSGSIQTFAPTMIAIGADATVTIRNSTPPFQQPDHH